MDQFHFVGQDLHHGPVLGQTAEPGKLVGPNDHVKMALARTVFCGMRLGPGMAGMFMALIAHLQVRRIEGGSKFFLDCGADNAHFAQSFNLSVSNPYIGVMSDNYSYKPKGIDIRVNKGKKKLDPDQRECDWAGCTSMGGCKAPKSPDRLREYYNFCTAHAREYNKNWNFFSGMTDEDIAEWQAGARHGHRPTWDVKKNTAERAKARKNAKAGTTSATSEGYGIFGAGGEDIAETPRRRLSKLQIKALNDMGLDETATKADVRKRYTQLVKQLHPDANQGDRNTEESFQRVVKAYKVLKTTELG